MKACNAEATQKALKGDARKTFMKTCLSCESAPANSRQANEMKTCNADASAKGAQRRRAQDVHEFVPVGEVVRYASAERHSLPPTPPIETDSVQRRLGLLRNLIGAVRQSQRFVINAR